VTEYEKLIEYHRRVAGNCGDFNDLSNFFDKHVEEIKVDGGNPLLRSSEQSDPKRFLQTIKSEDK
jgi:hypothetical protein